MGSLDDFIIQTPTAEFEFAGDEGPETETGTDTPPTAVPEEQAPSISIPQPNLTTILINTTATSRLLINISYNPGNPPGLLTWRKNGRIVSSRTDPRVNILSGGGISVRSVVPSDRGHYMVTASNRLGNQSEVFLVFVTCEL